MRISIISILLFFFSDCCFGQEKKFEINVDTIHIDIKGVMSTASTIYNGKYYCFFEKNNWRYNSFTFKHFYIISPSGEIENQVDVPRDIQNEEKYYMDVRNDSIVVKTKEYNRAYYFDNKQYKWEEIMDIDDLAFQDVRFYVTFLDFGESGSTVWFRDKKTNTEYEVNSTFPTINRLNDKYVVTNAHKIFEIENPLKMKISEQDKRYENSTIPYEPHEGSYSIMGTKILFRDTTNTLLYRFYIATSFIYNNELFSLCVDDTTTYLATLKNGQLNPVVNLGSNIFPNSIRALNNNSCILSFRTNLDNLFGFIELKENKIYIHYFKNKFSPKPIYIGENKADSAFTHLFDLCSNNFENLNLNQINQVEQKLESIDITPKHKVELFASEYPNKQHYEMETPRACLRFEDSVFTNLREYYYTSSNGSIKAIKFDWDETSHYIKNESSTIGGTNESVAKFGEKFRMIRAYISTQIGEPEKINLESKKKSNPFQDDILWKTKNGLTIYLTMFGNTEYKYRTIRLVIYNK